MLGLLRRRALAEYDQLRPRQGLLFLEIFKVEVPVSQAGSRVDGGTFHQLLCDAALRVAEEAGDSERVVAWTQDGSQSPALPGAKQGRDAGWHTQGESVDRSCPPRGQG